MKVGVVREPFEWPRSLDIARLRATGWRPAPFTQFVLKMHSRCNLACDYCYVYRMADDSWRSRPAVMSEDTLLRTVRRIAEHVTAHDVTTIRLVLHGGEPLLAGSDILESAVLAVRSAVGSRATVLATVQTNGTRIDSALLDACARVGLQVGVSLDGDPAGNDRHRRYPNGSGSHRHVMRGLRLLADRPELFAGLLCAVDLANDPVATYEALLEFAPPAMNFLLPHGNWTTPPPGRPADDDVTPYADWLAAVFDRWYSAPRKETRVLLFDEILHLLLGGDSHLESLGLSPVDLVVVDTDGAIEQVDSLRSVHDNGSGTGLNVREHAFDAALRHPSIIARQIGSHALGPECRECSVRNVCGGGLYTHRYRAGSGFRNRSVYCPDLFRLIGHIRGRAAADLRALAREAASA